MQSQNLCFQSIWLWFSTYLQSYSLPGTYRHHSWLGPSPPFQPISISQRLPINLQNYFLPYTVRVHTRRTTPTNLNIQLTNVTPDIYTRKYLKYNNSRYPDSRAAYTVKALCLLQRQLLYQDKRKVGQVKSMTRHSKENYKITNDLKNILMKSIKIQTVELNNAAIQNITVKFNKLTKSLKKCQAEIKLKMKKLRKSNKRLRRKSHQQIERHGRENLRH